MCNEDQANKVFGETAILHRTMHSEEFKDDVDYSKVAVAIETKEKLLDWPKFSNKLKSEIASYRNIKIKKSNKVTRIFLESTGKFVIDANSDSLKKPEKFDYVINCGWQNIEALDENLGIGDAPTRRNNSE